MIELVGIGGAVHLQLVHVRQAVGGKERGKRASESVPVRVAGARLLPLGGGGLVGPGAGGDLVLGFLSDPLLAGFGRIEFLGCEAFPVEFLEHGLANLDGQHARADLAPDVVRAGTHLHERFGAGHVVTRDLAGGRDAGRAGRAITADHGHGGRLRRGGFDAVNLGGPLSGLLDVEFPFVLAQVEL